MTSDNSSVVRSLSDTFMVLWVQRWLLVGCVALAAVLSVVLAYVLPIKYRAEVLLQPVQREGQLNDALGGLSGIAGLVGLQLGSTDNSAEAQAILESKAFTMAFVRDYDLMPVLFPKLWDAQQRRWKVTDPDDIPVELDAYRMFRDSIRTVSQDRQSRLVLLAIEWKDAKLAADWANAMAARVNEQMRKEAADRARRNLEFLKKEYDSTNIAAVRDTIGRVMESELKTAMIAAVQHDYAFRVIDPAVVPNKRFTPKRTLIVIVGVLLGGAIGVLIALLRGGKTAAMR